MAKQSVSTIKCPLISANEMAKLAGKTAHRLRQLEREGYFAKKGRNQYDPIEVLQGLLRFEADDGRRRQKTAAASRVQDARAREIELRTAREENRLILTGEAIAATQAVVGLVVSEMSGLPARVTRDLELRERMRTEIDAIFNRASALCEQRASDLRGGGEIVAPPEEDDA